MFALKFSRRCLPESGPHAGPLAPRRGSGLGQARFVLRELGSDSARGEFVACCKAGVIKDASARVRSNQASQMVSGLMAWVALFFLALVIGLTWLKARGNFIFTDCVVRNRAAIVEPWREYRKEGNSYFLFQLAVMFAVLLLAGLILASFVGLAWLKQGAGETGSITLIGLLVFLGLFWVSIVIFVSIATYFMVPVMYRRRCRAVEAFRDVTRLIWHHLGSFFLLCLFGMVLILAVLMIGAIVTCATCCLAALPYLGTVILLPLFVCLRAFGLLFLRQFGPDYDVWASFMPPEFLPILSGPLPAPPPTTPAPNPPPDPPLPPAMSKRTG